jgi:hypothetical protein
MSNTNAARSAANLSVVAVTTAPTVTIPGFVVVGSTHNLKSRVVEATPDPEELAELLRAEEERHAAAVAQAEAARKAEAAKRAVARFKAEQALREERKAAKEDEATRRKARAEREAKEARLAAARAAFLARTGGQKGGGKK